jgi:hypothetical protein
MEYNGKECKVSCNCVEVAEFRNGGNGVKSYQCLSPQDRAMPKIMNDSKESEIEKPDFNEWLLTEAGKQCVNYKSITEEKYLVERIRNRKLH